MRIRGELHRAAKILSSGGIEEPNIEAEILLMHVFGIGRARLYAQLEEELSPQETEALDCLINRRLNHEPSAYITNSREFFGLDFYVDQRVLIPRPESELLVEMALKRRPGKVCDVGTGSGAIAISIAVGHPEAQVYAIDISPDALEVAAINCRRHRVADQVHLLLGDMLAPLPEAVDLIVANLPYIGENDKRLSPEIDFEPPIALYGGQNGREKMSMVLSQAGDKLRPGGSLLLEVGEGQGGEAASLARKLFPNAGVGLFRDLSGIERVVSIDLA